MAKKVLRFVLALVGAALGAGLVMLIDQIFIAFNAGSLYDLMYIWALILIYVLSASIFAIIFYIISPKILDGLTKALRLTENALVSRPLLDIAFAVAGLICGLLVALLLSTLVNKIPVPWLAALISVGLYLLCAYLGVFAALRRRHDVKDPALRKLGGLINNNANNARPKVLDTSVIIDGRIFDICQTGVIEGTLVVPAFVLQELRHIADSADALKRGRGRRGLDILQRMQKELDIPIQIDTRDFDDISEVDLKLLKLAQELDGVVVTNDYNLNKVAGVQSVPVFNINELANAIKPVVLPGEEMDVCVIKEGKEAGQGIGYLEDGTMIVIEGGKRLIGENVSVAVTSVLQTSAGRMIFARTK